VYHFVAAVHHSMVVVVTRTLPRCNPVGVAKEGDGFYKVGDAHLPLQLHNRTLPVSTLELQGYPSPLRDKCRSHLPAVSTRYRGCVHQKEGRVVGDSTLHTFYTSQQFLPLPNSFKKLPCQTDPKDKLFQKPLLQLTLSPYLDTQYKYRTVYGTHAT